MMAAALALQLVVAAHSGCYVVTNTRITKLPTCDFGAATAEMLTEEPTPRSPSALAPGRRYAWNPAGTSVVRGDDELEHRLELTEQERLAAAAKSVAATQERDEALRERDRALRELQNLRRRCATTNSRAMKGSARRAG